MSSINAGASKPVYKENVIFRAQFHFSGACKVTNMGSEKSTTSVEYWKGRYNQKSTAWHIDEIHPILVRQISSLTGEDGQSKRVFVPLCGKTRDIAYLLSLGHQVFAIEGVLQPILDLAAENSLSLKHNPTESIYHTEDGRLKIYHGDLLKCPIERYGPFDCVWDRAAFIAFEYSGREAYVDVMKRSLLKPDKSWCLLQLFIIVYGEQRIS